jgi:hypothetical protein
VLESESYDDAVTIGSKRQTAAAVAAEAAFNIKVHFRNSFCLTLHIYFFIQFIPLCYTNDHLPEFGKLKADCASN